MHGSPLGEADLKSVKTKFGFNPEESFVVPKEVSEFYGQCVERARSKRAAWDATFAKYQKAHPGLTARKPI